MDFDGTPFELFGLPPPTPRQQCRCNAGWCPVHGTCDHPDDVEACELERREGLLDHSTRGGHRVVRRRHPPE